MSSIQRHASKKTFEFDFLHSYKRGTTKTPETSDSGTQTARVFYNVNPPETLTLPEGQQSTTHVFFLAVGKGDTTAESDLRRGEYL